MKKEHPNPQGQADKKMDWKKAEELLKEAYKQGDDRAKVFYGEGAYE